MVYEQFSYADSLDPKYGNDFFQYSWVKLETSQLLIYVIPLTADKDTNGDTGSKYIFVDKSPEFSYEELANATDNFSLANKVGQGGFGEVYYGELRGKVCNLQSSHC
jgi:hypothetical protein